MSALLASPVLAIEPLTAKDGVTNHPVLFVHGINSDMGTWGGKFVSDTCTYNTAKILSFTVPKDYTYNPLQAR